MIVDCAHYKDGARQHEGALNPEQAAEIAERAREGEFIWIGVHEPQPGDLDRMANLFHLHELAVEDAMLATSARRSRITPSTSSSS